VFFCVIEYCFNSQFIHNYFFINIHYNITYINYNIVSNIRQTIYRFILLGINLSIYFIISSLEYLFLLSKYSIPIDITAPK